MSVVTAHMVYFCAFARSVIFQENARKSGVGRRQFDAGVNGLNLLNAPINIAKKKLIAIFLPCVLMYQKHEISLRGGGLVGTKPWDQNRRLGTNVTSFQDFKLRENFTFLVYQNKERKLLLKIFLCYTYQYIEEVYLSK